MVNRGNPAEGRAAVAELQRYQRHQEDDYREAERDELASLFDRNAAEFVHSLSSA